MFTHDQPAPTLDADEVAPALFVGSVPPPDVGAHGFDAVVLCAEEHQYPAHRFPGVEVLHAPLDDAPWRPMTRREVTIALAAARRVAALLAAGKRVLVTCAAGLNRSALVAGLAMRILLRVGGVAAIGAIRAARSTCALCNERFVDLLLHRRPRRSRKGGAR
jgi:hypothetical protein